MGREAWFHTEHAALFNVQITEAQTRMASVAVAGYQFARTRNGGVK